MMASQVVSKARKGFIELQNKPLKFREEQLKKFRRFFKDNGEKIIQCMIMDMRKHTEEARLEILIAVNHLSYMIYNLSKFAKCEKVNKRLIDIFDGMYIHKDPYGVVLIMASWNVPILTMLPVAGAIAAGNAVVIKPSHNCPNLGNFLSQTLPKYLDNSFYQVFLGGIPETQELLMERFDYIYYTGSVPVGKLVHAAATKNLTPVTLELGGKNPLYIDDSSDLVIAARRIIWGKLFISGQTCIAPDYILSTKDVRYKLFENMKTVIQEFCSEDRFFPIVNENHFQRLQNLLTGLNIVYGGHVDSAQKKIEVTIAFDVPSNHPIMEEEIFGPILVMNTVRDEMEAIEYINSKPKPLTLYVFSENSKVKKQFVKMTSSGQVVFNDILMQIMAEELPFGGVGNSGMGVYKGQHSYDTFCHKKSVLDKNTYWILEKLNFLRYPPLKKSKSDFVAILLKSRRSITIPYFSYILVLIIGFVIGVLVVYYGLI